MQSCPRCHESRHVAPLVDVLKSDSAMRPSEFGWIYETSWGALPNRRTSLGGGRIARRVIGQLKRPPGEVRGTVQQVIGFVLGAVLAVVGIPAIIFGLFLFASVSVFLLLAVLIFWAAGVILLLRRAFKPGVAPSPYRRAMVRLDDLSYCDSCAVIFDRKSGRVVPDERLHEALYSGERENILHGYE